MRILWQSNAPWCPTGYGKVTAAVVPRIQKLGYDTAIFAFYGLRDGRLDWNGVTVYPNNCGDWGRKEALSCYRDFKADILITLEDAWVLRGHGQGMRWFPYIPVDHDPIPPRVHQAIDTAQRPIAMSLFGENQLRQKGLEPYYAPHGVDTEYYYPNREGARNFRQYNNIDNKFVVGFVGTNKIERKNIQRVLMSFAQFHKRCPDSVLYLQTDWLDKEGIPIKDLSLDLGIANLVHLPSQELLLKGLSEHQIRVLYNSFDVFFLPSKGEGFGIPIIEAQSCGLPVIVTDFTSMPELVGGGWTIKNYKKEWQLLSSWWADASQEDCVNLLRKAYRLWQSGGLAPYQEKAREKALEYDWDKIVEEHWKPILKDIEENLDNTQRRKQYYVMRAKQEDEKWVPETFQNYYMQSDIWYNRNRNEISLKLLGGICKDRKVLALGARGWCEKELLDAIDAGEIVRTDLIGDDGILEVDALDMPFEDKSFDVVICRELIEHLADGDKLLREIHRVLKNEGFLLITTTNVFNFPVDGREHLSGYSPMGLLGTLKYHGFKLSKYEGNIPNIFGGLLPHKGTMQSDKAWAEFIELADRLKDNADSYYYGTQLFVLARKATPRTVTKIKGKPNLDIIVFTHNHLDVNKRCIDSLYRSVSVPFKLTVVDDRSEDGTREWLETLTKVNVVKLAVRPKGGAEHLNTGLKNTNLPFVVLMNNDVEVLPNWIEPALKLMEDPQVGIVGFKLLYHDGTINHAGIAFTTVAPTGLHWGRHERWDKYFDTKEMPAVTGACVLVRREAVMPGYDEDTFDDWTGCEDTDMCLQVKQKGYKVMYCGKSMAYHAETGTIARDADFFRRFERTKQRFIKKWGPS